MTAPVVAPSEPVGRAARARAEGLAFRSGGFGLADLVALGVTGADAAAFLNSQVTNEVEGLSPGQGNLSARVERTGHLVAVFSLHRLADQGSAQRFLLLLPREDRDRLLEVFQAFLFADRVQIEPVEGPIAMIQGEGAHQVATALGFPGAPSEGSVAELDEGTLVVRSLTGDPGLIGLGACAERALSVAKERGMLCLPPNQAAEVVEILRIEAGLVRPAVDLPKRRLLPETGLEQHAVSYTKGCYLGQEVIARVRTYGSVPFALRALLVDGEGLDGLPAIGEPILREDGTKLGQAVSRCTSPVANGPVLLAYLGRDHRTPQSRVTLRTAKGLREARVALLPLYRAADHASKLSSRYDRAIRTFADGDPDGALALLEDALRIDPGFGDAYEAIGVILGRSGRYHEAIDFFQRLAEVAPEEPLVHTNLSLYYMKIGDKSTAEEHSALAARKSMAKGAGESRSAAQIATEADQARRADAARKERMFKQVLDFDPVDPIALFGLGSALVVLERWDEAVRVLAQAAEVDRKNSAIFPLLGKAHEHLDQIEQAREAYRQGIEIASRRGDLMPLREMQSRLLLLGG
ncbi:MAG: hypothetical protein EA397_00405 [Deltaproteobacteria bacterium]|nr:MAG: hypothetical protein EA397_00405 [Deltaproteobacteria bacterium]